MPIYEYQCQECEHLLEALQRMSESVLLDCPECGKPALRKLISAPGFRLKGSGWYETDFKTGNKKNLAGDKEPKKTDGAKGAKDEKKKSEAKSDKTPVTKSGTGDSTNSG